MLNKIAGILLSVIAFVPAISLSASEQSIPVFVSSDGSIYEEALAGMQSVSQFTTEIYYVELIQAENPDLASWFSAIKEKKPPFVITFGLKATRLVRDYAPDLHIVFSMISGPKSLLAETENICGVSMDTAVGDFFATLKEIKPSARKVIGFYSVSSEDIALEGSFSDLKNGLVYVPVKLKSSSEFADALEKHTKGADAVYMVPDALYTRENFEILSKHGKENSIIIMTTFSSLVKMGATFGLSPDYAGIGIQTGEMANRLFNNSTTCSKELVKLPESSYFYLNDTYSEEQKVNIPEGIKARAQTTRLFIAGVKLLKDEKLGPARKIFESILEKDADNKAATLYLEIILEKQSGNKTRALLAQADKYIKERKYSAARVQYAEALRLNPKNEKAKAGIREATFLQSEEYRAGAGRKASAGQINEAIRGYQSALRILPSNNKARTDLANLRSRESRKIPGYLQQGLEAYNKRNYETAIKAFDNILLVQPGHAQANEYLRLSQQKKEAADKLLNAQKTDVKNRK